LAVNSEGRGSRIETLEGDSSGANIEDIEMILRRLVKSLRIPESYLGVGDERTQWNDGRVGTVYNDEMRYASRIQLIQKKMVISFKKNFMDYLALIGIEIKEEFELELQPPQSFGEYKESELNQQRLNVANSATGMDWLSARHVALHYLGMDQNELIMNENLKLMEKGIDPENVQRRLFPLDDNEIEGYIKRIQDILKLPPKHPLPMIYDLTVVQNAFRLGDEGYKALMNQKNWEQVFAKLESIINMAKERLLIDYNLTQDDFIEKYKDKLDEMGIITSFPDREDLINGVISDIGVVATQLKILDCISIYH